MKNKNYDRKIFGVREPRMKYFYPYEKKLNKKEKDACYLWFFDKAMREWPQLSKPYQKFLIHLARHDWDRFVRYSNRHTIFGHLRCPLKELRENAKLIHLHEKSDGTPPLYTTRQFSATMNRCFERGGARGPLRGAIDSVRRWLTRIPIFTDKIRQFTNHLDLLREEEEEEQKKREHEKKRNRRFPWLKKE